MKSMSGFTGRFSLGHTIRCLSWTFSIRTAALLGVGSVLLLWDAGGAWAQPQWNVYFGNLHSHTKYSDGTATPEEAYAAARAAGLDFLAITEHNHSKAELGADERADDLLIATQPALYQSVIDAAGQATQNGAFVALYGQEFSSISSGNHANVFDVDKVIDETQVPNGNFKKLYETWLPAHPDSTNSLPLVQFNHPDIQKDLNDPTPANEYRNDYGYDEYGESFAALRRAAAPAVRLIELLSGPATRQTFTARLPPNNVHESDYLRYLARGFKVAPTGNQDNHYFLVNGQPVGSSNNARTGVLAQGLTKLDVLSALKARRCYATEDKDLEVRFSINDQPMGTVFQPTAGPIEILVQVKDRSEPSASYRVELFSGVASDIQPDTQLAAPIENRTLAGDGQVSFASYQYTGEARYYFAKVIQNPQVNNGFERAWSAPIWLESPTAPAALPTYAWSVNSSIYHRANCQVVSQIRPENLQRGNAAPAGRNLHNGCPQ